MGAGGGGRRDHRATQRSPGSSPGSRRHASRASQRAAAARPGPHLRRRRVRRRHRRRRLCMDNGGKQGERVRGERTQGSATPGPRTTHCDTLNGTTSTLSRRTVGKRISRSPQGKLPTAVTKGGRWLKLLVKAGWKCSEYSGPAPGAPTSTCERGVCCSRTRQVSGARDAAAKGPSSPLPKSHGK